MTQEPEEEQSAGMVVGEEATAQGTQEEEQSASLGVGLGEEMVARGFVDGSQEPEELATGCQREGVRHHQGCPRPPPQS